MARSKASSGTGVEPDSGAGKKELKARVAALEKTVAKLESKLQKQRDKVVAAEKKAARSAREAAAEIEKYRAKAAKARRRARAASEQPAAVDAVDPDTAFGDLPVRLGGGPVRVASVDSEKVPQKPVLAPAVAGSSVPDETWTVTRLRAEARSRAVPGYSRKSKAQLLEALAAS
ncbi:hypothetical protein HMPREF0063_11218 [Aeromicrobium marinum DSM 15272]|uniref:Rho termination factor N-terminal domain-containing protein n=1 Tax=Aeromicrobium marinum DSM 15272 TaxID=585531 RepID=E2SB09_9ACTN|nr:hypothetical protein [Aeromicrobium marinum]EFQ83555.1 hypothetical protein HMPREF0063_11218 [Aeromicrobium marinum DSM 15272]